jgi:phage terminase large subunit GpA-like protein
MALHQRLAHGETILFSDQLGADYFDQIRAERLVVRYTRGQPVKKWELTSGRRNEALDSDAPIWLSLAVNMSGMDGWSSPRTKEGTASRCGWKFRSYRNCNGS